jgi:DNA-binding HxlR family transcriptional regulator
VNVNYAHYNVVMISERLDYGADNCSIAAALAVVGEKWTLLVLREAFFGLRRFEDFHQVIGCARNILGDRLSKLVGNGLLDRVAYREEGQRERFEYLLTEKGVELFPVLVALMQWGDHWLTDNSGGPVVVRHQHCGADIRVELRCADGHGPLSPRDTFAAPGKSAILAKSLS